MIKIHKEGRKNTYFWTCPKCGAHLDPNEKCNCKEKSRVERYRKPDTEAKYCQLSFKFNWSEEQEEGYELHY